MEIKYKVSIYRSGGKHMFEVIHFISQEVGELTEVEKLVKSCKPMIS